MELLTAQATISPQGRGEQGDEQKPSQRNVGQAGQDADEVVGEEGEEEDQTEKGVPGLL